jgi:hypothetical protein
LRHGNLEKKEMSITTALGIGSVSVMERTPKIGLTHWIEREQQ